MLDLHCHILPGVDDGPRTLAEALAVAQLCIQDGITHVVATPHCHRHLLLMRDDILPHVAAFNAALQREQLLLTVLPGSEIQLTDVGTYRRNYDDGRYCHLGDRPGFTLLEFPWSESLYPDGAREHVAWLRERGTTPIVAHPERHPFFRTNHGRLFGLVEAGAWLQITVDSLLGKNGPEAEAAGEDFLRDCSNAVLATDAHRPSRCSGLSVGYRLVSERLGAARADELRARADHILRHILDARAELPETERA